VRATGFREKFSSRLELMGSQSCAFGNLTVRSILDMREHCLTEFDFHDVYLRQKQLENKQALALLPEHLGRLAGMEWEQRQEALALGFLAGNVFDWGAKEVALLMEAGTMDFQAALGAIGSRPWRRPVWDDVDRWIARMRGPPHRAVCIFIDNSGGDIILGVLPFVEELLRRGSTIILCANSRPILNDVTYAELSSILGQVELRTVDSLACAQVADISPTIGGALESGLLVARDSGQGSPCLDLARCWAAAA
jgi:type II pantothenate kinase